MVFGSDPVAAAVAVAAVAVASEAVAVPLLFESFHIHDHRYCSTTVAVAAVAYLQRSLGSNESSADKSTG